MKFTLAPQSIPEVLLIRPTVYSDNRGYFKESYNLLDFDKFLPSVTFVQDNESKSLRGVLRGFHFQKAPHAQAKLVRAIQGVIWDVALDIRPDSSTYGQSTSAELSAKNHHQLYIPQGFAHAFLVLSDAAIVQYKTDNFYHPQADAGIHPHDPDLNIPWPLSKEEHLLSAKDSVLPLLKDLF